MLLEELVGVLARWQVQHPQLQLALQRLLLHLANGALGGAHPSAIGIEIEDDPAAFTAAAELGDLLSTHGGTLGRHRMALTGGMQGNHIEIALHHQGTVSAADGIGSLIKSIEVFALVKHLRFRGVEVFRFAAIEAAAAKANDSPLPIVDGDHQPMAEAVVETIAPFARHHQSGGFHQAGINPLHLLEVTQQPIPSLGGIAQFKGFDRAGAQPPLFPEVVERSAPSGACRRERNQPLASDSTRCS